MLDNCSVKCWCKKYRRKAVRKASQFQSHRFPRIPFRMVRAKVLVVDNRLNSIRHEELYVKIEDMVIRSDELPKTQGEVARMFGDVTVVLCTLSMLSNPKLKECGLIRVIPVTSLVIDEASQIDVFEFMVISVLAFYGQLMTFCV